MKTLSEYLKTYLEDKDKGFMYLSRHSGLSITLLDEILTGKRKRLSMRVYNALVRAGMPADELRPYIKQAKRKDKATTPIGELIEKHMLMINATKQSYASDLGIAYSTLEIILNSVRPLTFDMIVKLSNNGIDFDLLTHTNLKQLQELNHEQV